MSAPLEEPLFGGVDPQLPEPRRGGGRGRQTWRGGGRFGRQGYGGSFGPSEIHQRRRRFPVSKGEFFSSARRSGDSCGCVGGEEAIIAVRPNGLPRVWLVCSGSISVWWTARQRATTGIPGGNACALATGLVNLWIRSQCLAPRLSAARLPPQIPISCSFSRRRNQLLALNWEAISANSSANINSY